MSPPARSRARANDHASAQAFALPAAACGRAVTAAFVNDPGSPLARAAQWAFPLHAGAEDSVAATKSFIAQMVAGARMVAAWQDDTSLSQSLAALPAALQRAVTLDWSAAVDVGAPR